MKLKSIITLILLLSGVFSFSQLNQMDSKGKKHGKWIMKYKGKDAIRYKGVFEHGVPQGIFLFYYESGKIKVKNKYLPGGKDSFALTYHENGKKMSYGKFVNQKRDSVWRYYNDEGNLIALDTYKDGKKHGKSLVFYTFNRLAEDTRTRVLEISWYKFGEREGDWHKFYNNGKMMAEGTYEAGVLEGRVTYFYTTGKKKMVIHYKHGIKQGFTFNYDGNEKLTSKQYYKNGTEMKGKMLTDYLARKKKRILEKRKKEKKLKN